MKHIIIFLSVALVLVSCKDFRDNYYWVDIQGTVNSATPVDNGDGTMDHVSFDISVINNGNSVSTLNYIEVDTAELGTISGQFVGVIFRNLGYYDLNVVVELDSTEAVGPITIADWRFDAEEDFILRVYNGEPISSDWSINTSIGKLNGYPFMY